MSYTYRFARERVNDILKMLPPDDRAVLDAYVCDVQEEARMARPVHNFAVTLGIALPTLAAMLCGYIYVSRINPAPVCETCAVCPTPEPVVWGLHQDIRLRRLVSDRMTCLWPADSWVFMCTIKAPKPEDAMPAPPEVPP